MHHKEKATILRVCSSKKGKRCSHCLAFGQGDRNCARNAMKDAATAITELSGKVGELEKEIADREEAYIREHGETHYWRDKAKDLEKQLAKELPGIPEFTAADPVPGEMKGPIGTGCPHCGNMEVIWYPEKDVNVCQVCGWTDKQED